MALSTQDFHKELVETIRYQAYLRYLARDRTNGDPETDWYVAELEVIAVVSGALEPLQPDLPGTLPANFYHSSAQQARHAALQASIARARMLAQPTAFGTRHWRRPGASRLVALCLLPALWFGSGTGQHTPDAPKHIATNQTTITSTHTPAPTAPNTTAAPTRYTIQLLAVRSPERLPGFVATCPLDPSQLKIVHDNHSASGWHLLWFGQFEDYRQATRALAGLPSSLLVNRPFIRPL